MKKTSHLILSTFTVVTISWLYSIEALAQSPENTFEYYSHLGITVGVKPVSTQANTVTLRYQDESPTTDFFSSDRAIEETEQNYGLDVVFSSGKYTGHHFELGLGGSFGVAGRFYGQTGLGWNIPFWKRRIIFRPVANVAFGTTHFDLGDMQNTSVYIQVNDIQFYSETVDVRVSSKQLAVQPRVDLLVKLSKTIWIQASAGYRTTLTHFNPFIRFDGQNEADESTRSRENLSDSNIFLRMNDQEVKRLPVDLDGIFYSVGLAFEMGR